MRYTNLQHAYSLFYLTYFLSYLFRPTYLLTYLLIYLTSYYYRLVNEYDSRMESIILLTITTMKPKCTMYSCTLLVCISMFADIVYYRWTTHAIMMITYLRGGGFDTESKTLAIHST